MLRDLEDLFGEVDVARLIAAAIGMVIVFILFIIELSTPEFDLLKLFILFSEAIANGITVFIRG